MKFKTRLQVTLITIIVLPLLLTVLAYCFIGATLVNFRQGHSIQEWNYSLMTESFESFANTAELTYEEILEQAKADITKLEDTVYLQELNDKISKRSAYLLVRKNNELYYTGNEELSDKIFDKLPDYNEAPDKDSGYYFKTYNKYVKQYDFVFRDGAQGSIFVVTKMNTLISRELLVDMFIAILLILIFTGIMLTLWFRKSVFTPLDKLDVAMRKIKEGNFDYMLETDLEGEIGDLYRNYEDMRLRLRENAEEKIQREKQNRELISNISHDLKNEAETASHFFNYVLPSSAIPAATDVIFCSAIPAFVNWSGNCSKNGFNTPKPKSPVISSISLLVSHIEQRVLTNVSRI